MYKKTMIYYDYDGNKREEDLFFNLSKAEMIEMQMSTAGGYDKLLTRISKTRDTPELVKVIKDFILKAYGVKSDDGKRFIKSEELSTAFSQTEAYSNLYVELCSNDEEAAKFFKGVLPADMKQQLPETTDHNA